MDAFPNQVPAFDAVRISVAASEGPVGAGAPVGEEGAR